MLKTIRTLRRAAVRAEQRAAAARDRGNTTEWFRSTNNAARIRTLAQRLEK